MPTITPILKKSTKKGNSYSKLIFRVSVHRGVTPFYTSDILVNWEHWDTKKRRLKDRAHINPIEREQVEREILLTKTRLLSTVDMLLKSGIKPTSREIKSEMNLILFPKQVKEITVFYAYDEFLEKFDLNDRRRKVDYAVLRTALERYEKYKQFSSPKFSLVLNKFTAETALDFDKFIRTENEIYKLHPTLYKKEPKRRSENTFAKYSIRARVFFNWCVKMGKINLSPYNNIDTPRQVYGTPYYLTIDERNKLFNADLSTTPETAVQRDIFVFHCCIGCRVGDLIRLKKSNIINGAVEYIAGKTKDESAKTIRVPLNKIALEILEKYKCIEGDRLLPFISEQKYNDAIKRAFTLSEINRIVTVMDTHTRKDVQKPLNEIASSHLARRTLYANVYKKFKDTALAGSLTGHSPNSRSALRYRDIDDEMKAEAVRSLE